MTVGVGLEGFFHSISRPVSCTHTGGRARPMPFEARPTPSHLSEIKPRGRTRKHASPVTPPPKMMGVFSNQTPAKVKKTAWVGIIIIVCKASTHANSCLRLSLLHLHLQMSRPFLSAKLSLPVLFSPNTVTPLARRRPHMPSPSSSLAVSSRLLWALHSESLSMLSIPFSPLRLCIPDQE